MTLPAPTHRHQLDGSAWGGQACMAAAGAMALDAYTGGRLSVSQHDIRAKQDDKSGGIGLDDVATAWRRGWGQTFTYSFAASWSTVLARLRAGDGVVVTVNYGALGTHRAPGSRFTGAHALYLQRLATFGGGATGIVVNDPLRRSAVTLPESAVKRAYTGGAGWGKGTYQGGTGASSAMVGAFYRDGRPLVQYPRGSTAWNADTILATLNAASYFGSGPAAAVSADITLGIMRQSAGQPWNEQLIALWSAKLLSAAGMAGVSLDPTAGALPAIAGALTNLPDTLARGGIVVGLVALAIVGLVLTFREPLAVAIPSPARRLVRG